MQRGFTEIRLGSTGPTTNNYEEKRSLCIQCPKNFLNKDVSYENFKEYQRLKNDTLIFVSLNTKSSVIVNHKLKT